MHRILIGGLRKEIGKLFEMLLWKPDRSFSNAYTLDRCIRQAKSSAPDLLIIDSSIDSPERCFEALAELKETADTAEIPVILLTDQAQMQEDGAERLLLVADEHIAEPFNPAEIKSITEQFI